MGYKDPNKAKEYMKAWYQEHKESEKANMQAYYQAHKEARIEQAKAWYQAHKEQVNARVKAWRDSNKEQVKARVKADVNANGETKHSIRLKSRRYLSKYGTKIPGYQIHHCCTYTEPYKFIYCSKETHNLIHAYLRQHNISADSDHYEQIKHLLDDTVVLYGLE